MTLWSGRGCIVLPWRTGPPAPLTGVRYGWLPQKSGCRLCGEPTCLAFAAKLILGEKQLKDCPPIWETGKEDLLEPLQGIMKALGV
uniref:(Fe-S)-binding protein n=1 Tax=Desulforadius tongensis TaxID=1216062 RepID=UPI00195673BA|nr:(Fe-S)-binding protein [Desulforadius tongensis]